VEQCTNTNSPSLFVFRFFLIFIGLQLTLFGVNMLNVVQQHLILPWTAFLARACVALVTWFDATAAASGKVLWNSATGFGVSIEPGCNGIEACIVLFAAVMAFTSGWRYKLLGLGVGFVAVQALNVVRVISLYYLGQWNTEVFHFAHAYLWQGLIMFDVLVVWLLWARGSAAKSSGPSAEPAAQAR
jgi:exosortase H (IPTLxxWG-CTERM-specific)